MYLVKAIFIVRETIDGVQVAIKKLREYYVLAYEFIENKDLRKHLTGTLDLFCLFFFKIFCSILHKGKKNPLNLSILSGIKNFAYE